MLSRGPAGCRRRSAPARAQPAADGNAAPRRRPGAGGRGGVRGPNISSEAAGQATCRPRRGFRPSTAPTEDATELDELAVDPVDVELLESCEATATRDDISTSRRVRLPRVPSAAAQPDRRMKDWYEREQAERVRRAQRPPQVPAGRGGLGSGGTPEFGYAPVLGAADCAGASRPLRGERDAARHDRTPGRPAQRNRDQRDQRPDHRRCLYPVVTLGGLRAGSRRR